LSSGGIAPAPEVNVFGEPLVPCSTSPMTGFFRTGGCMVGPDEVARHLVCCEMTAEFLSFSKSVGNDLSTPNPAYGFPGLKPGNRWCLHILRWKEALEAGKAPRIAILSTNQFALEFVELQDLKRHAFDLA
jgi:uncharacterized protein (DUF2237 family)